jgi:hypothetical protein
MSQNNHEEIEILEEQNLNEEASEEILNEEAIEEQEEAQEIEDETEIKPSFFKKLGSILVDEALIGLISVGLLYLGEAILKLMGYFISQKISMMFIIFVIVSVIYRSVKK